MQVASIEVEPVKDASKRRRDLVELLKKKKADLLTKQPTGLCYFELLGAVGLDLSRAMGTIEQRRCLVLFGRVPIPLPPKVLKSRIPDVNF